MLVCGLDLEATDLDTDKARVIEVGAVLYDTDKNLPVQMISELIIEDLLEQSIPTEVEDITKISYPMLKDFHADMATTIKNVLKLTNKAQAIVAHNGHNYDQPLITNFLKRHNFEPIRHDIPWIDTLIDLDFPSDCPGRNLLTLSAYHGFVNPFPHRAFSDVLSMLKILSSYNVENILEIAKTPIVKVFAKVSFHQKDLAKDAGFKWNPEKKVWFKDMREANLTRYLPNGCEPWPFEVKIERPTEFLF